MTLEKWAESLGTSQEATDFGTKLVKSFGQNQMLSAVALAYKADQISSHFGINPFVLPLCQALKPFWDKQAQSGM